MYVVTNTEEHVDFQSKVKKVILTYVWMENGVGCIAPGVKYVKTFPA